MYSVEFIIIGQYTPTLFNISEEYSADNVTVTVEWATLVGATYKATISPLVPITLIDNENTSSAQLVLQYSMEFNLSVVAVLPCGANATTVVTLNYGEA